MGSLCYQRGKGIASTWSRRIAHSLSVVGKVYVKPTQHDKATAHWFSGCKGNIVLLMPSTYILTIKYASARCKCRDTFKDLDSCSSLLAHQRHCLPTSALFPSPPSAWPRHRDWAAYNYSFVNAQKTTKFGSNSDLGGG